MGPACETAGQCSHRGLIDSTAESANYMSTRDNHVVGDMSRCESNDPYLEATLGLVKRLEISKELIRECVTVPGCCCCMPLLHNHLISHSRY